MAGTPARPEDEPKVEVTCGDEVTGDRYQAFASVRDTLGSDRDEVSTSGWA